MFTRRHLAAGMGLSLVAPSALAGAITPVSQPRTSPLQTPQASPSKTPEEPVLILDASLDQDTRMMVPVMLNGQGPFEFVVDTGAGRSVLSPALAERLALPSGPPIVVHGISGAVTCPTAVLQSVRAGDAHIEQTVLPILPRDRIGADGLLGVDVLEGRNVVMDFRRQQLLIRRSQFYSEMTRSGGDVAVAARSRFGRLTLSDARVAGTRAVTFIDSGGGVSIGNLALAEAIAARRRRASDIVKPARLLTAGGEAYLGQFRVVPNVTLGNLQLTNIPMAFADLHIFDVWGLNDRPAALLGVDILRLFARVELDFGDERVLFRMGQGGLAPPVLQA